MLWIANIFTLSIKSKAYQPSETHHQYANLGKKGGSKEEEEENREILTHS